MYETRVLSGMRPTGSLHLGHYHGVLKNWVRLQAEYPCLFFVADWHALTTDYEKPGDVQQTGLDMVIDWLAAGVDPSQAMLFVQSQIAEHAELHLLLSMMAPLGWLERVPTYRDQQQKLADKDLATYGFLGYPLLQSADILIYRAKYVPVGEDQVPHVEFTRGQAVLDEQQNLSRGDRERLYGWLEGGGKKILVEPEALLTEAARMPGLDGQKMSKSYGNTIALREEPESVAKKVKTMPTDPARVKRSDPGNPEKCPVWDLHKVYSDQERKAWVMKGCTTAGIGCLECKQPVIDAINLELAPIRGRAQTYLDDPTLVKNIVADGCEKAKRLAAETMREVREAMGLTYA